MLLDGILLARRSPDLPAEVTTKAEGAKAWPPPFEETISGWLIIFLQQ
jgi:hypothetical protein